MNGSTCSPTAAIAVDRVAERARRAPFVPHRPISVRTAIWCFLLGLALVCPLMIIIGLIPLPPTAADAVRPARFLKYMLDPGPLFLKAVILAPLWEEFLHRGLILQLARRFLPLWAAIFISTAIFVAPHLANGLSTATGSLLLGTVMALLVVRTGSLYASVLFHATFNLSWLFVLGPAFGITEKIISYTPGMPLPNPLTDIFPAWWIVVSVVLVSAAIKMLGRETSGRARSGLVPTPVLVGAT
jgi:membrane protease YdiL (CAAX protease family)